ncbi:MAG: phosphoglucosamine mutase [Flavobacteriales bacterium]|nr:phosphoglucosamine mutase [Flavobacteriales bacterium]MDG1780448.1 phosphoglucosamine mutase [Flavobacteriales bacterium]MDG2245110.1 phosphoglucosamine mutase [Flavobacteriales bacterium]
MSLIKSISGIRGTIGGAPGEGLTPIDVVRFTAAFASVIKEQTGKAKIKIVIGRDARISGAMVRDLVVGTLSGMGVDVIDLDLSTTPTVEVAVPAEKADAGIILTASHNPKQWNALKLLNGKGEFISGEEGQRVLELAEKDAFSFAEVDDLGTYTKDDSWLQKHIDAILAMPLVDVEAIRAKNFSVACDCVNSTGGIFVPALLEALGVTQVHKLFCDPTGHFPHNPEPLPEHLTDLAGLIKEKGVDLGIVVDPDVDRLAFVCEDGSMFGEEYTLVAVADYILSQTPGNTVSNMSSTRALRDVTEKHGGTYKASAVGEVNVVAMMKDTNAIIGGEGNGGIIFPELHYGRDALVGIALFLTHLAKKDMSISALRASYPNYAMSKNKIQLEEGMDVDGILSQMATKYASLNPTTIDGVKIDFENEWVHLRKSNTEPIIRIYSEAPTASAADELAQRFMKELMEIAK